MQRRRLTASYNLPPEHARTDFFCDSLAVGTELATDCAYLAFNLAPALLDDARVGLSRFFDDFRFEAQGFVAQTIALGCRGSLDLVELCFRATEEVLGLV